MAKRDIVINKIQQLLKRTATLSDIKQFIQSSSASRNKSKYQILSQLEYILVEEQSIIGLYVFDKKNKLVLSTGKKSDLSLTFSLNYSNDIIDDFGINYGKIDVYLSLDKYLNELSSPEYTLSFSKYKDIVNLLPSKNISNYFKAKDNIKYYIRYKHHFSRSTLYYLPIFILLVIVSIYLIRKLLIHIAKPISDISSLIFEVGVDTYSTSITKITELNWIYKIINDRNISLKENQLLMSAIRRELIEKSIRQIHFIKSMISSLKISVDYEIDGSELSHDIKLKVDRIISTINCFIKENILSKDIYNPLRFSTIGSLRKSVLSHARNNQITSYVYNKNDDNRENFFIPLSSNAITTIINNIITNSIQANASRIEIDDILSIDNGLMKIKIQDNGSGINFEKSDDYFYGISTKVDGTGVGLSESKKLLLASNGNISFIKPNNDFSTAIEISLPVISPKLDNIIKHITSSIIITELVTFGSESFIQSLKKTLAQFTHEKSCFSKKDGFITHIKLSNSSHLSSHQLLILESNLDLDFYMSSPPYSNILLVNSDFYVETIISA